MKGETVSPNTIIIKSPGQNVTLGFKNKARYDRIVAMLYDLELADAADTNPDPATPSKNEPNA